MSQEFKFDSQQNEVRTEIRSTFRTASKILGWGFPSEGLGINSGIIDLVLRNKSKLSVYLSSQEKWMTITFANLQNFMKNYNTEYRVKSATLYVLPIAWFDEE